jgi:hypothetical protein
VLERLFGSDLEKYVLWMEKLFESIARSQFMLAAVKLWW